MIINKFNMKIVLLFSVYVSVVWTSVSISKVITLQSLKIISYVFCITSHSCVLVDSNVVTTSRRGMSSKINYSIENCLLFLILRGRNRKFVKIVLKVHT